MRSSGRGVLELETDAGELKIVPEPTGTRGYDDLRRRAERQPLGQGLRPSVADEPSEGGTGEDHRRRARAPDRDRVASSGDYAVGADMLVGALLRSGYQRDSALWIHRLAVRCQELEPAAERSAYAQRPRPKPGQETAEALLASVPGISTTSARSLLDRFGGVSGVVAAGPAEWLTVPGIGPERARALEETFNVRPDYAHDRGRPFTRGQLR